MKKFLNKYKFYFLAFLIPCLAIIFVFLCNFIFIKNSILLGDLRSQYLDFFAYYKNLFSNKELVLYSFSNGLGDNMIGTLSYYLGSPLNLILLLFKTKYLDIGISILIIIKLALAGLTMFIFLKESFKYKNQKFLLMFSTCYAFMMYTGEYFINIMWFDGLYLAPLILLGINKIIDNRSSFFYYITLFLAIISNYYIGFMLCIFSVIYFVYKLLLKYNLKKDKKIVKKVVFKFLLTSILSAFSCFILIIPTLYQILNTSKENLSIINFKPEFSLSIIDNINNLFIGRYDKIPYNENVLFYCGMLILILNILYFYNKKIKKKENILSFLVILIFILSFSFNYLNCIWHGFAIPNGYSFRNSFLLSLFMIMIACKSFLEIKGVEYKQYFKITAIISLLVLICQAITKFKSIDIYGLISIIFTILYFAMLYIIFQSKKVDKKQKKLVENLLIIVVCLELLFNFFLIVSNFKVSTKYEYYDYYDKFGSEINKIKKQDNNLFYRIHIDRNYGDNDSFIFNINSLTEFNSTVSKIQSEMYQKLGLGQVNQLNDYKDGRNSFIDSIFGVKYLILNTEEKKYIQLNKFEFCKYTNMFYMPEAPKTNYYVYKNPYSLNLGYMINDSSIDKNNKKIGDYLYGLDYQNYLYLLMSGDVNNQLFENIEAKEVKNKNKYIYKIEIKNKKDIYISSYIYFENKDSKLNMYVNGEKQELTSFYNMKIENNYNVGDEIEIKFEPIKGVKIIKNPKFYNYNDKLVSKFYKEASANQLNIISFKDTNIKGTITSTKDKNILFTTIPYDKGWSVKVDGKKEKILKLYDAFLGVKLEEGEHEIELSYFPPGLKIGSVVSMISLVMFIAYFKFENKKINN